MNAYERVATDFRHKRRTWLVTGVAGFIGSNLLERLLLLGQNVVGIDNFSTGHRRNLDEVEEIVGPDLWKGFSFIEGDIRDLGTCRAACEGVDFVLQQAALGSVPRSIADPILTNSANIDGFLNMLVAARDANVKRFIFAASSSTYGDDPRLPRVENQIGRPLSPYAITKYVNELYAAVFSSTYGIETVGLRYFNVFGRRQDPNGAYAAVIPRWVSEMLKGESCQIYGDGKTTRDFCYIENVVQANLLATVADSAKVSGEVFNVAYGGRTTLLQLHEMIKTGLRSFDPSIQVPPIRFEPFRRGDVRDSQADITKARERLGYDPTHSVADGLGETLEWYVNHLQASAQAAD
jgi:UDP-N-acetylglucosamine/UDP-N-acetylgalactosamine 4-epimerase